MKPTLQEFYRFILTQKHLLSSNHFCQLNKAYAYIKKGKYYCPNCEFNGISICIKMQNFSREEFLAFMIKKFPTFILEENKNDY